MPYQLTIHLRNSESPGRTKLTGTGYAIPKYSAVQIKTIEKKTFLVPWDNILLVEQSEEEIENVSEISSMTQRMFPVNLLGAAEGEESCDSGTEIPVGHGDSDSLPMAASQ